MNYLFDRKNKPVLPKMDYVFETYEDFVELSGALTTSLFGNYKMEIININAKELLELSRNENSYPYFNVYVPVDSAVVKELRLIAPALKLMDQTDFYSIWLEQISKYQLNLTPDAVHKLYWAIPRNITSIIDCAIVLEDKYHQEKINYQMAKKALGLEDRIFSKMLCVYFIRQDRYRWQKLDTAIKQTGEQRLFYSMRKNLDYLLEEKFKHIKQGTGSDLIKTLPLDNMLRLKYAFTQYEGKTKSIYLLLNLYEKGETYDSLYREDI